MTANRPFVRPATEADLTHIIALDQDLFGWYGAAEDPKTIEARLAVFPEGFIVLEEQGSFLGYGSAEKWLNYREPALDEDPFMTHHSEGRIFCITTLAVKKEGQGRGLGKILLDHFIGLAKEHACTAIVLETAHAVGFYLRQGFQQIGERQQREIRLIILQRQL